MRMVQLPDVPTFKELGYPQLSEVSWFGVWSRPDIPADVQARVREIALQYFRQPQVESRLRDMGMEPGTDARLAGTDGRVAKGLPAPAGLAQVHRLPAPVIRPDDKNAAANPDCGIQSRQHPH